MLLKPTNWCYTLGGQAFSLFIGLAFSLSANALEFRSIEPVKAILYDAPSLEASKLYILGQAYPVEILVNLNAWVKVRDATGSLSWIESKQLSPKHTVLVLAKTDMKLVEDASSAMVAILDKDVVLELLSTVPKNGWVKVKHRDGITGYVKVDNVWGVN